MAAAVTTVSPRNFNAPKTAVDSHRVANDWWKVKFRRTFIPGKCRAISYQRPPIDRAMRKTNVTYDTTDDSDRELLARTIFVEESLRFVCNDDDGSAIDAVADEPRRRHRCSDPRDSCDNEERMCEEGRAAAAAAVPRRRRDNGSSGQLLSCISMYFAYFHDIKRVYHVTPLECDVEGGGGGELKSVPFGATIDSQSGNLYIYCDDLALDRCLILAEGVPDHRLVVNDTFVPRQRSSTRSIVQNGYGSQIDRRALSVLACIMNVERLIYDALKCISMERTLAELTFPPDERRAVVAAAAANGGEYEATDAATTTTMTTRMTTFKSSSFHTARRRNDCFL